jgi:hypothetical protein
MQFEALKFEKEKHLKLLHQFLKARGLYETAPIGDFLPPTGVVITNYGKPICIGFMIKCDNRMVIFTDFVSDISAPKELRNEAVIFMREHLEKLARHEGFDCISSWTSIPKHRERLKKLGFTEIENNLTHFGRFLWLSQG